MFLAKFGSAHRRALCDQPAAQGVARGELGEPQTLQALVERIAPDFLPLLLKPHDGAGVERRTISPERENAYYDPVRRFPTDRRLGWMF